MADRAASRQASTTTTAAGTSNTIKKGSKGNSQKGKRHPKPKSKLANRPNDADNRPKVKVLCLHGHQQTGEVLRNRLYRLTNNCRFVGEFNFPDGPFELDLKNSEDDVPMRSWLPVQEEGESKPLLERWNLESLSVSLLQIEQLWKERGPFDTVIGFSLGGMLASVLKLMPNRFPELRNVIVAGAGVPGDFDPSSSGLLAAFLPKRDKHAGTYATNTQPTQTSTGDGLNVDIRLNNVIFFAGRNDTLISVLASQVLFNSLVANTSCKHIEFVEHTQSHVFPCQQEYVARVRKCLEQRYYSQGNKGSTKTISKQVVARDTVASVSPAAPQHQLQQRGNQQSLRKQQQQQQEKQQQGGHQQLGNQQQRSQNGNQQFQTQHNVGNASNGKQQQQQQQKQQKQQQSLHVVIQKPKVETVAIEPEPCISDEAANDQSDELEALESIYTTGLVIERPAPNKAGDLACSFSVTLLGWLNENDDAATEGLSPQDQRTLAIWSKHGLKLHFDCPGTYPECGVPRMKLLTGAINGLELPGVLEKEMLRRANEEAVELDGCPSAFASVSAVDDFISSGEWVEWWRRGQPGGSNPDPSNTNDGSIANSENKNIIKKNHNINENKNEPTNDDPVPFDGDVEAIPEEDQNRYVREATVIAIARSTNKLAVETYAPQDNNSSNDEYNEDEDGTNSLDGQGTLETAVDGVDVDDDGDGELEATPGAMGQGALRQGGAGGLWNFVVAAVGKPSVGKSTFFNALIRLKDFERKGADTAPHPFTTIEPNIATGWWAGPNEDTFEGQRGAAHGRDPKGRRYLPLLIKDVAGLVPGAYQGRGKGNKFLNDLCDADALVHVIDASGQSDRQGNILTPEDVRTGAASTPQEDAEWVREELHRWIFDNVAAKWPSCTRKAKSATLEDVHAVGNRVTQLFSGYRAKRWVVDAAARCAELEIDQAATWTVRELHLMVACFLSVRFPICLALNKVDQVPEGRKHDVDALVKGAQLAGNQAAVPMCAFAETWLLEQTARGRVKYTPGDNKFEEVEGSNLDPAMILRVRRVLDEHGSTGVLEAITKAVLLRSPILVYPVSDLNTEAPMSGSNSTSTSNSSSKVLVDCLQMKPRSTVAHVYDALKHGALVHTVVKGDFVRAEAKGLDRGGRKVQLGRNDYMTKERCVIRVMTNRKSVWQGKKVTGPEKEG